MDLEYLLRAPNNQLLVPIFLAMHLDVDKNRHDLGRLLSFILNFVMASVILSSKIKPIM